MPQPSLYHGTEKTYTPQEFADEFRRHGCYDNAANALGMSKRRVSVILSRLRKRGYDLRLYKGGRKEL